MGLKEKTISGIKWNGLSTGCSVILQILKLAILTRLLEQSDFGLIAIGMTIMSFTDIFCNLGLTSAIIHKQNITEEQYSSLFWMNLFLSLFIYVVLCCITPLMTFVYKEDKLNLIIPLLGLQIIFCAFGKMFQTFRTKEMDFNFISKVSIVSNIIGFILTILLAKIKFGVYSLVWGHLATILIMQSTYSYYGLKEGSITFHFRLSEVSDFLKIGIYQLGAQLLDIISSKLDIFLIGYFFGMSNLGTYNIAKDLIMRPYSIVNSLVVNVVSAAFSKIQSDIAAIKRNFAKIQSINSMINFFIYTAFFVFADLIVSILYAPSYQEVSVFIRILSGVGLIASFMNISAVLQISLGRTDLGFKWTIIRVLVSTIAILVSSLFSIYAVAYSQLIIFIIFFFAYYYIIIGPLSHLSFKEYLSTFKRTLYISLLIVIVTLPVSLIASRSAALNIPLAFVFTSLFIALQYRYNRDELLSVVRLIKK